MANTNQFSEWRRCNRFRKLKSRAVRQIKQPTEAEGLMWQTFQRDINPNMPEGSYFQRQYVCDPYIIDFFCKALKVAVEVDGSIHDSQIGEDRRREAVLRGRGIDVLRIRNTDVFDYGHRQAFAKKILYTCFHRE